MEERITQQTSRHVGTETDKRTETEIHETAFRQAQIQIQTADSKKDGRHRESEVEVSNLGLLLVKKHQGDML